MANTGKDYEMLIRHIYQDILRLDGVENIEVQHNVILVGKSGAKHQIDVFWRFVLAGIQHQVIIQAKDWSNGVDQGEVLKFLAVLDDLPGQPRGVMVARSSFQSGALTVAQNAGLVLYELREVRESDFTGLIKEIQLQFNVYSPRFRDIQIIWDLDWIKERQITAAGRDINSDAFVITDRSGNRLKSFTEQLYDLIQPAHQEYDWKPSEIMFDEDRFLEAIDGSYPKFKILGVRAEVKVTSSSRDHRISYKDMFEKILASVTGGESYLVSLEGKVTPRPRKL